MKNTILFFTALLCTIGGVLSANAQYTEDFRAKEVLERVYVDVKGSPYLSEEFVPAFVKLKNGKTYKEILLKYDQVTGQLVFKDNSGRLLTFADPVAEFKFTGGKLDNQAFRSGFRAVDTNNENSFYQVIYDGGTIFLKDPKKNMVEHRSYNSSTTVKSIQEIPAYYLVINGGLVKIKKDKKSIFAALSGKSAELEKFLTDNKLNLRDDADVARLVQYYDSIKI